MVVVVVVKNEFEWMIPCLQIDEINDQGMRIQRLTTRRKRRRIDGFITLICLYVTFIQKFKIFLKNTPPHDDSETIYVNDTIKRCKSIGIRRSSTCTFLWNDTEDFGADVVRIDRPSPLPIPDLVSNYVTLSFAPTHAHKHTHPIRIEERQ